MKSPKELETLAATLRREARNGTTRLADHAMVAADALDELAAYRARELRHLKMLKGSVTEAHLQGRIVPGCVLHPW